MNKSHKTPLLCFKSYSVIFMGLFLGCLLSHDSCVMVFRALEGKLLDKAKGIPKQM